MKQKHMVAVCDILGFSNLVESVELDAVVMNAIGWFRKALHHSLHKQEFPQVPPSLKELDTHAHVGVAWFSDTVLLYAKDDSDSAVRELLTVVAWLLFETMMQGITRVRAGIAYGEVFIDSENSIYVGKPIVEAYRLEQEQQWSGAALAESAEERIPASARSGQYADWCITPYDVPLKSKGPTRLLAVNWNQGIHSLGWRLHWSSKSDMPGPEDWALDQSKCEKFVNTKAFHEMHCIECCPSHKT